MVEPPVGWQLLDRRHFLLKEKFQALEAGAVISMAVAPFSGLSWECLEEKSLILDRWIVVSPFEFSCGGVG